MNTNAAPVTVDTTKLAAAFAVVDPDARMAPFAANASWKDEIAELVTDEELTAAGVTIDDVTRAIEFYTATTATVSREQIAGKYGDKFEPARPGYFVRADGYRKGPAGDH